MATKIFLISFFSPVCYILGSLTPSLEENTNINRIQAHSSNLSVNTNALSCVSQLTQNQTLLHSYNLNAKSCENYGPQGTFANFTDSPENTHNHEVERMIADFAEESKLEEYIVSKTFDFEQLLSEPAFDQENNVQSNDVTDSSHFSAQVFPENSNNDTNNFISNTFDDTNNFMGASNMQDISAQSIYTIPQNRIAESNVNLQENARSIYLIFQNRVAESNVNLRENAQNFYVQNPSLISQSDKNNSFQIIRNCGQDLKSIEEENISNKILRRIINEDQKINLEIIFDHKISAPLSEYFNNSSAKKIRAYLIVNGYEYLAIKAYKPEKFVILRAKTDIGSEVREGKLFREYIFYPIRQRKTFKTDCSRLENDSEGNLYLLQYSRKENFFDISVFTPDLECIKSINYKNYFEFLKMTEKVEIINLRIHNDELYLLDSENGRVLIANLDFKVVNYVKIKTTFFTKKFVQLAVSNKYIAVLNNNILYVCKQNQKEKGFKSFQSSSYIDLESFEFLNENIILAKNHRVQILFVFKIHENDKGELFFRKNEISLFNSKYNQKSMSFALNSDKNIFAAYASDNEVEILKLK